MIINIFKYTFIKYLNIICLCVFVYSFSVVETTKEAILSVSQPCALATWRLTQRIETGSPDRITDGLIVTNHFVSGMILHVNRKKPSLSLQLFVNVSCFGDLITFNKDIYQPLF